MSRPFRRGSPPPGAEILDAIGRLIFFAIFAAVVVTSAAVATVIALLGVF